MVVPQVKIRGLDPGFERIPLRHFKGVLDGYQPRAVEGNFPGIRIDLQFKDLEVILSDSPWEFPIAQISIKYSDRENSTWGIFAKSLENLVPANVELDDCKGRVMEMLLTPGHEFGTDRTTSEPIIRECWEVQEVEGFEVGGMVAVIPLIRALTLLDGKATQEWHQVVFADAVVKGDGGLTQSILANTFLPAQQATGVAAQDENGVWHVDLSKVQ